MSDNGFRTVSVDGRMSPEGVTNRLPVHRPELAPEDKKVICSAICYCKDKPGTGKNGQSLKQMCVSSRLREVDTILKHRSPYKAEVNYDMTQSPPTPIMDSSIATKVHDYLPGFISKHWEVDHGSPYLKGMGNIRRPDVIIVNDPTKPPTQDNIKQVVEIKFPPDELGSDQKDAYEDIAGGDKKLVLMGPDDCNCDEPDGTSGSKIPVNALSAAAAAAAVLGSLLTKRPPGGLVPAY